MAELANDTVWRGLPRVTTDVKPGDEPSRAMPDIDEPRLGKAGWWSSRNIHPVYKDLTGVTGHCEYLGELPKEEVKVARKVYQNRLHDT
jgi:hypothetical protein